VVERCHAHADHLADHSRRAGILEDGERNASEFQRPVDGQFGLVLFELHFLDAVESGLPGGFDSFERPRVQLFMVQAELGHLFAGRGAD
jgi:hypothetical protein